MTSILLLLVLSVVLPTLLAVVGWVALIPTLVIDLPEDTVSPPLVITRTLGRPTAPSEVSSLSRDLGVLIRESARRYREKQALEAVPLAPTPMHSRGLSLVLGLI